MVRHSRQASELWSGLPWTKFRINLFRLQRRVYKAVLAGDKRKARSLQKLILKSQSGRYLAIRQVTQLNAGKKTAGVDGKSSLNFEERLTLSEKLKAEFSEWKHQGLREINIPKKDGTTRILKVPTIADRAWQCLAKYALEPAHEATFHGRSYGFRPGRGAHDAQKVLFLNLSSNVNGIEKRVIELDIEKCFDRIDHNRVMKNLIAPWGLTLSIWHCLKAGTDVRYPNQGIPQGSPVSPLLANIALNGIEDIHNCVRYADDMVFVLKPNDDAEAILQEVKQFLSQRGLNISQSKTKITATTDGFDFLGWHFRVQNNGKFRCIPSVDNYKAFQKKVKAIVNCSNYGADIKAQKLAPLVRGWRNYHRFCKMDGARNSLSCIKLRAWSVFNHEPNMDKRSTKVLIHNAFPAVPFSQNRHINVKGSKSPFDGDLRYWSKRNCKLYNPTTSNACKKQNHLCHSCGLSFLEHEKIHLHHADGNHDNWNRDNLLALHQSCHDYLHRSKDLS